MGRDNTEQPRAAKADHDALVDLTWRSMRDSLLFYSIPETTSDEDCDATVTLRVSHITTVIVTLNTPNNLEHVRIFIPRAPTLGIPETPEHHMLGTDRYVGDSSHLSSTRKVHLSSTGKFHVYITRKSIFPLTRKSIFPLTRKSIFPLQEKSMFTLQESPYFL